MFRGGLALKARRLGVLLNSRRESHKEEEEGTSAAGSSARILQGYLVHKKQPAHKKQTPPGTLQNDYTEGHMVT